MKGQAPLAPTWRISAWFNSPKPLELEQLRGQVIALHAFQMLCPGCVSHGLPQAQKIADTFPDVVTVGLHTVFEHHEAMTNVALKAFLDEYRIRFPVGVDEGDAQTPGVPMTMKAYGLQGTPSLVLIDRQGRLRARIFGRADDMVVGARIAALLAEPDMAAVSDACSADGCRIPAHTV